MEEETVHKSVPGAYGGAVSFEQAESAMRTAFVADEIAKLNWAFQDIVANIMNDGEIVDKVAAITALVSEYSERIRAVPQKQPRGFMKSIANFFGFDNEESEDIYDLIEDDEKRRGPAMKRENGIDFPARDFAYVPDASKPATWKLRLTESPGKVSAKQLGRAAAALSTGGFRGKRASIPKEALSSVKRRIRSEYRKLGVPEGKIPSSVKIDNPEPRQKSSFMVLKDADGEHRWFAIYSNNYRDDDLPPEIISEASHRAFVKSVEAGVFDMPELWLWHYDHPVGDADWLDFTSEGLALASGTFRPGYERTAKALADSDEPLAVSHGMPTQFLVRDEEDPSIILFHVTKEISPLPLWAAANRLTGFAVLEGAQEMPISDERKDFLRDKLPPDIFDELNEAVGRAGKAAAEDGRESKEKTSEEETEDTSETKETPVSDNAPDEGVYVTRNEIIEVFTELTKSIADALNGVSGNIENVSERMANIESSVKELQTTDAQKVAHMAEGTPKSSLSEILSSQFASSAQVGKSADGTDDGPRQEKEEPEQVTGIPVVDNLIFGSMNGRG